MDNISIKELDTSIYKNNICSFTKHNAFMDPDFLEIICKKVIWYGGFKGEKLLCLWPITLNTHNEYIKIPFTSYVGPHWDNSFKKQAPYKWYATSQKIYKKLFEQITLNYSNFNFSLSREEDDIRAFLWWNYGKEKSCRFSPNVKYTALINNLQSKNSTEIIQNFRIDDKRKKIKKLLDNESNIKEVDFNISFLSQFIDLYQITIDRAKGIISENEIYYLEKIIKYVSDKTGKILCLTDETNRLVASQLMLKDFYSTNAVAQVINTNYQRKNLLVLLVYKSIIYAKNCGSNIFDFNGANSPNRADDKHSYGACTRQYFDLNYGSI
tara:strand:+ start:2223 stop:3197 length:975 start_codon:yes stop_codon:yes gene_type:complete